MTPGTAAAQAGHVNLPSPSFSTLSSLERCAQKLTLSCSHDFEEQELRMRSSSGYSFLDGFCYLFKRLITELA